MHPNNKMPIANDIFELCIKLNLETKRGNEIIAIINQLREKLDALANFKEQYKCDTNAQSSASRP